MMTRGLTTTAEEALIEASARQLLLTIFIFYSIRGQNQGAIKHHNCVHNKSASRIFISFVTFNLHDVSSQYRQQPAVVAPSS